MKRILAVFLALALVLSCAAALAEYPLVDSPAEFNQRGEIPYTVIRNGREETKFVTAPNNYMLEVEQLSRCILTNEKPLVSRDFSLMTARVTDRILDAIGY